MMKLGQIIKNHLGLFGMLPFLIQSSLA
uniref:Uncharacterized protein n=1 Tax=Arundo donax TaxID=35708 RepID=A0A0A9AA12_ARUDO